MLFPEGPEHSAPLSRRWKVPEGDRSGDFLNPAQQLVAAAARPELSRLGHTPW